MTEVVLSPGVIVEHVGGELLVVVPGHTDVVKLTGGVAKVLEDIRAGKPVDLSHPAVSHLLELGIVSTPGVSRRGLIKAGAIGAGAGIAVLTMPGVAAAASSENAVIDVDLYLGYNLPTVFQFGVVLPGFDDNANYRPADTASPGDIVVDVQSSSITLSVEGLLSGVSAEFVSNGIVEDIHDGSLSEDGLLFDFSYNHSGQSVSLAEIVFTVEGVTYRARYTAPDPQ
jgi:hypothetical protein